jgi:hypothetical protein
MSRNSDNRKRAFADAVTIDAWHNNFSESLASVDLHVDVVFGTARVGGEVKSPVRFRLSVRRAQIVVIIPESEPLTVDRALVARDDSGMQGHLTEVVDQTRTNAKATVVGAIANMGFIASTTAQGALQASIVANKPLEVSSAAQMMMITQSKTAENHYRWLVAPRTTGFLEGRPWDATTQPRLRLVDKRADRSRGIPPTVLVEVRCLREDLVIDELTIKDENLWEATKRRAGFKNRMAAAESYIRDRLWEEGLEVQNISDIFGQLTLGRVIAEPI